MRIICLGLWFLAACAADPSYTGTPRRFVIDAISLPRTNTEAKAAALDLNGDGVLDNHLGQVTATLSSMGSLTEHGDEMIAAGRIGSSIEITADDLSEDDTVAVRWYGNDGDDTDHITGRLVAGRFETTDAGQIATHLPIFDDADPSAALLRAARLELVPDGRGGFDARVGGGFDADAARDVAWTGAKQMMENRPYEHMTLFRLLDTEPRDHVVSREEWDRDALIGALLASDLVLEGREVISIGFSIHLTPCDEGTCTAEPADHCVDRVLDGDESDIDCGGACGTCMAGRACRSANDCDSNVCDAGACAPPSCSNGIRDGIETDIDCGGACAPCALGEQCWIGADCASGQCGSCTDGVCYPSQDICQPA